MSPRSSPAAAELELSDLGPDATAGDAVRRALRASTNRLLRHEPGVRDGDDPEDVHQARVATRRLRSDLRTFAPLLDREWLDELRGQLSWLAAELGSVRDAEVLRDRLHNAVGSLPTSDRDNGAAAVAPLMAEARRERRRLVRGMRSKRYVELRERLIASATAPALLETASTPASPAVPRLARRPWRRLKAAAEAAGPDSTDEELHALRITAKRSRYAAEAASTVAGRPATAFARSVAELQDVLGELHDAVVAEAWLRTRAAAGGISAAEALAAGELVSRERDAQAAARARWPEVWEGIRTGSARTWM